MRTLAAGAAAAEAIEVNVVTSTSMERSLPTKMGSTLLTQIS